MSWDQRFLDPIELPGHKSLITLRDAATYIMKLSKAEQDADEWQAAIECLMLVGDHGGDTMLPHIAIMKALDRGVVGGAGTAPEADPSLQRNAVIAPARAPAHGRKVRRYDAGGHGD
jgi:hypothetical protein